MQLHTEPATNQRDMKLVFEIISIKLAVVIFFSLVEVVVLTFNLAG